MYLFFKQIIRMSVLRRLMYRADLLIAISIVFMEVASVVVFARVVYSSAPAIGGMPYQALMMITATMLIIDGLGWLTFRQGFQRLGQQIREGAIDQFLIKPIDTMTQLSFQRVDIEDVSRLGIAVLMFARYASALGVIAFQTWCLYAILLVNAWIVYYSVVMIGSMIAFWTEKFESFWLLQSTFLRLGGYPVTLYPSPARIIFLSVLPVGLLAAVPAHVLTSTIAYPVGVTLGSCAIGALLFFTARVMWKTAIRKYTSASS